MSIEKEIEDLEAKLKDKKEKEALLDKKRRLECELREECPSCGGKGNAHGSPCTDGMW
jgi:DnaJ-class molecular chaperone